MCNHWIRNFVKSGKYESSYTFFQKSERPTHACRPQWSTHTVGLPPVMEISFTSGEKFLSHCEVGRVLIASTSFSFHLPYSITLAFLCSSPGQYLDPQKPICGCMPREPQGQCLFPPFSEKSQRGEIIPFICF